MITIKDGPSFLATGKETQTPTKVQDLYVQFKSVVGTNDGGSKQGYIVSTLEDEAGNIVMQNRNPNEVFSGLDILFTLHADYTKELSALNPKLTIKNSMS